MANKEQVEETVSPTPQDAWLKAYLETLVYHEEAFRKLEELQTWVWHLTHAMGVMNDDLQVLLRRTRGGYWAERLEQLEWYTKHLEGRLNEEVTAPKRKPKGFTGIEL